ncbi:unnamed protein product [Owenia fusiformis]|uniref:Uncharacterized protein n=1 Tax=Owenia fusiformis TaxID=6347 RepID=A0A8J1UWC0_OWEFU|nr:unnamed protein product [Owenia fusiformis]
MFVTDTGCPVIYSPTHGWLRRSTNDSSVIVVTCREGYEIVGSRNQIQCQDNGQWSARVPECTIKECPYIEPPMNGRIEGKRTYKSIMTISCKAGYELINGKSEKECLSDGTWSSLDSPVCADINRETCNNKATKFPNKTCNKKYELECPNTFACNKKEFSCCQVDIPQCSPLMKPNGIEPEKCRGGRSVTCPKGYRCHIASDNTYSICCLNITCVDSKEGIHDYGFKPWRSLYDKCNMCTCEKNGQTVCTDKKECRECNLEGYGLQKRGFGYWNGCWQCICISPNKRICTSPCDRGHRGDLSAVSSCSGGCSVQASVRQCIDVDEHNATCMLHELEYNTCRPDSCPHPGIRIKEDVPIIIGGLKVKPPYNWRWMRHLFWRFWWAIYVQERK